MSRIIFSLANGWADIRGGLKPGGGGSLKWDFMVCSFWLINIVITTRPFTAVFSLPSGLGASRSVCSLPTPTKLFPMLWRPTILQTS